MYGYIEETFAVCRYTHDIPFPGKGVYRVWDFILYIWGLEVFLLYKQEKHEEANARTKEIDSIRAQPVDSIFNTPEKRREFIDKLYQRVVYPDVLLQEKIEKEENERNANEYRFLALIRMVGCGATGLYPNLSAHWNELQQDIDNYVSILSKEK